MPYNGTGTFNRLYSWVADANAGKVISATEFDADGNDVAAALSLAITKDGQQTVAANIPWNGKKITNLGAPTQAGDALSLGSTPASEITRLMQGVTTSGSAGDFGVNGSYYNSLALSFTAMGTKLLATSTLGLSHGGSSGSVFYSYLDVYDNVAAAPAAQGSAGFIYLLNSTIPYGTVTASLMASNLTPGRSYTLRLWQERGTASGPTSWTGALYGVNI